MFSVSSFFDKWKSQCLTSDWSKSMRHREFHLSKKTRHWKNHLSKNSSLLLLSTPIVKKGKQISQQRITLSVIIDSYLIYYIEVTSEWLFNQNEYRIFKNLYFLSPCHITMTSVWKHLPWSGNGFSHFWHSQPQSQALQMEGRCLNLMHTKKMIV